MSRRRTLIIVTLGPATATAGALRALKARGVDFVRTNMSHSSTADLKRAIEASRRAGLPFIIDTEGSQVRSGELEEQVVRFEDNDEVRLWNTHVPGHRGGLPLRPPAVLGQLREGDLVHLDFDTLVLRITDVSTAARGHVTARTVSSGWVGRNKAVVVDTVAARPMVLPALSDKDHESIRIGLAEGIDHIAVSFVRSGDAVDAVRDATAGRMKIISKIECIEALEDLDAIIDRSDYLLIDRGDLSKEIAPERIPFVQKAVIAQARARGKGVLVATNLLETMIEHPNPTRAEIQDVVNTVLDGAAGLTLAAETAVGRHPIQCVTMLDRLVTHTESVIGPDRDETIAPMVRRLVASSYVTQALPWPSLPAPHGGALVHAVAGDTSTDSLAGRPTIVLDERRHGDLERICSGAFSPVAGFMAAADLDSVVRRMALADGTPWPLPVYLDVDPAVARGLEPGATIALADQAGAIVGLMSLEEVRVCELDDVAAARGAAAPAGERAILAGPVRLCAPRRTPTSPYQLSPRQTRTMFQARGWRRILGAWWKGPHTAGAPAALRRAFDSASCDGLLVQVAADGATGAAALETCERAAKAAHERDSVLVTAAPMIGTCPPAREALLAALCLRNFGCTHVLMAETPDREVAACLERLHIEVVSIEPSVEIETLGPHPAARTSAKG